MSVWRDESWVRDHIAGCRQKSRQKWSASSRQRHCIGAPFVAASGPPLVIPASGVGQTGRRPPNGWLHCSCRSADVRAPHGIKRTQRTTTLTVRHVVGVAVLIARCVEGMAGGRSGGTNVFVVASVATVSRDVIYTLIVWL